MQFFFASGSTFIDEVDLNIVNIEFNSYQQVDEEDERDIRGKKLAIQQLFSQCKIPIKLL